MTEAEYMRMALALAEKGAGFVNPNPLVGAVIVRDGAVIGRGGTSATAACTLSATP